MGNKKRKLSVAISALVLTVNSVQNSLGDFESHRNKEGENGEKEFSKKG